MDIGEIFDGRALTGEEFEEAMRRSGLSISKEGREDELTLQLEREREAHGEELRRLRASSALRYELLKEGAQNPDIAATALGVDGICGDDGEIAAAAHSRVAALKRSDPYMFRAAGGAGSTYSTGARHGGAGADTDSMSDSEYYSYIGKRGI